MIRTCAMCLSLLTLVACTANAPHPQNVSVSAVGIEVQMSNRQSCLGPAPQPDTSWSGTLQGCDASYPYRVEFDERRNPIRTAFEIGFAALGLQLAPVADVQIYGPAGNTWRFASPDPVDFDD